MIQKYPLLLGRIGYLNVLPIYHPLEAEIIPHDFEIVSGTPALLNNMMEQGKLHVSSTSCFEYACRPERYYIVENLSIGSHGPVMSVLLLSQIPVHELEDQTILISAQTHTSAALLQLLLTKRYKINTKFETASISPRLRQEPLPTAFLAIGDEALRLRNHPDYPYRLDLAEEWMKWTNLPFIFGLWVICKKAAKAKLFKTDPAELLCKARDWGLNHLDIILDLTAHSCPLSKQELYTYYTKGLVYTLQNQELDGLKLFYEKLTQAKLIREMPKLNFYKF